jgi:hypothetical protein
MNCELQEQRKESRTQKLCQELLCDKFLFFFLCGKELTKKRAAIRGSSVIREDIG